MEYGININYFTKHKQTELENVAKLVSKAGFRMLDYTPPLLNDNWDFIMQEHLKIFNEYGLKVHQTHAPFNRYGQYGDKYKVCLDRCAEATAIMGAEFMVTHGDEFDFDNLSFSPDAALEYNYKLFLPCVEFAEKNGYKVAFETVFEDNFRNTRRFTSQDDELMKLITSFESSSAVCCWDFGHANISFGKDMPDVIKRFDSLIQCTHLHDNTGIDSHQIPMTGDIDWKAVMSSFRDIGYEGILSIEYAHGSIPEKLRESFIQYTFDSAKYLWNVI